MKAGDEIHIPHEGEHWKIVRSAIEARGGDFIADIQIDGGRGVPTHFHAHEDEVIEIFEGSLTMVLPDGPVTLRAGDKLRIPAGTPHSFKTGPDGFRGRGIYNGRRFEELVAQLVPGDKRGFIRMAQHLRRTGWAGSRMTSPAIRAVLTALAAIGALFGIRPRPLGS